MYVFLVLVCVCVCGHLAEVQLMCVLRGEEGREGPSGL